MDRGRHLPPSLLSSQEAQASLPGGGDTGRVTPSPSHPAVLPPSLSPAPSIAPDQQPLSKQTPSQGWNAAPLLAGAPRIYKWFS